MPGDGSIELTSDSLTIIEELFNKEYENNNYKDELEEIDPVLFRSLYDFLEENDNNKYNPEEIYESIQEEIRIHSQELNKYIAKECTEYITKKLDTRYDFVFKINNKTINICIRNAGEIITKDLNKILVKLIYAISIVINLSEEEKTIDMVIYLTPFKKKLDGIRIRESLTPDEINSGSTLCSHQPHIIVNREEEFYKVVIHELIHAMNYDVKSDTNDISQLIKEKMNIDTPFNHFEAYTEIWANILNAYFISKYMNRDKDTKDNITFDFFVELVNIERLWSIFQTGKILYLTNCDIEPYIRYKSLCKLNLNTNVYAYFILRSCMMFNINDFIVKMKDKNLNYINLNSDVKYFNEYVHDLINKTIHNKNYKSLLKKNIRDLTTMEKKSIQLSLRMSACELKLI
mgnify:CR=1 FL=1|tara:strand:- start:88 stop:1296 length:1209 start_codon:yes stop_codon:yes gene_type:complete